MALENLKSIFQDELLEKTELFQSNQPVDRFDTKFNYNDNSVVLQTYGFAVDINPPILDSVLRGRVYEPIQFSQDFQNDNLFVKPETGEIQDSLFQSQLFDPRSTTPKEGTLYFNTNNSFNPATNPTDFSTAIGNNELPFTPLTELGGQFKENLSWESLYNSNHTPKNNPLYKGNPAVNYGVNVNRDNLKIGKRDYVIGERYGFSRGDEPYVVSSIGNDGRDKNKGGRSLPIDRALTDSDRILNFLTSEQGIAFALQQNVNIPIQNTVVNKNGSLVRTPQRFGVTYNPLSALAVQASRLLGQSIPNILIRKSEDFLAGSVVEGVSGLIGDNTVGDALGTVADLLSPTEYKHSPANASANNGQPNGLPTFSVNDTFTGGLIDINDPTGNILDKIVEAGKNLINGETAVTPVSAGDKMTLSGMIKGENLFTELGTTQATKKVGNTLVPDPTTLTAMNVEAKENGMPFYFKDMRDSSYIFFRAYLEGLSENISPSWTPQNYIGRSEPVYIYERAEREIQFTLKLVAQTKSELVKIYEKMDKLTSLCYPQYMDEDNYGKNRMKPPLTKFRLGEMFGYENNELMGFLKSIAYSVDQSSTWEVEEEKRVPKHVSVSIGYQVIHGEVPNMKTNFYGINK